MGYKRIGSDQDSYSRQAMIFLVFLLLLTAPPLIYAADVEEFVVFGLESVTIEQDNHIKSGALGSNTKAHIKKNTLVQDPVYADVVQTQKDTVLNDDVHYNQLQAHSQTQFNGQLLTPLDLPVLTSLPALPTITPGNTDVKPGSNAQVALEPGDYDEVILGADSELTFTGGTYNIRILKFAKDNQAIFLAPTVVNITQQFKVGKHSFINADNGDDSCDDDNSNNNHSRRNDDDDDDDDGDDDGDDGDGDDDDGDDDGDDDDGGDDDDDHCQQTLSASDVIFQFAGSNKVQIQQNTVLRANILAPKAQIDIDKEGDVTGALLAKKVHVKKDSTLMLDSAFSGMGENTPPVANAGDDQTIFVTDTVTLDGSGSSDADGDELTFNWSFVSKPADSNAVLSDSSAIMPSFVVDKAGSYVLQLIVNDGLEDSASDEVTIDTLNSPPVADAGDDQTVVLNQTVPLDGSASFDVDDDTLTYAWTLIEKPTDSNAELDSPTSINPNFVADKAGIYRAQLIVNDGEFDSDPDTVVISTGNSQPVADAGADQTGSVGDVITLDGSHSFDADGDPLSYQWSFTTRPDGSDAEFDNSNSITPSFTADLEGMYVVQLIVNDGELDSDADTAVVEIEIVILNQPPSIDSEPVTAATVNMLYNYDVDASDPDVGDTLSYSLDVAPAGMTIDEQTGLIEWTPTAEGGVNVTVRVSDDGGLFDTQGFTITVSPANTQTAPDLIPAGDRTILVAQAFSTPLFAIDPDVGDSLVFSLDTAPAGMALDPSSGELTWTPNTTGSFAVTARVTDSTNLFDTESFTITVIEDVTSSSTNRAPNLQPIADRSLTEGELLSIQTQASDPDAGDTLSYSLPAAPAGMTISTSGLLQWTATPAGVVDVTVKVSDPSGLADYESFTVNVNEINAAPVANDDIYQTRIGQTLNVPAPGVLENDHDPNNDALTAMKLSDPTLGTLNFNADGSFDYTPEVPVPPPFEDPVIKYEVQSDRRIWASNILVADVDQDGKTDVITRQGSTLQSMMNIIDGESGSIKYQLDLFSPSQTDQNEHLVTSTRSTMAVGDLDLNGYPDILIVAGFDGCTGSSCTPWSLDFFEHRYYAFEYDPGTDSLVKKYVSDHNNILGLHNGGNFINLTIANITGDERPEVLVGYSSVFSTVERHEYVTVYNHDGSHLWTARGGGDNQGHSPNLGHVVVADLDLDGDQEILWGDDVFDHQGQLLFSVDDPDLSPGSGLRSSERTVVNIDDDPYPEIIHEDHAGRADAHTFHIYEHDGTLKQGNLVALTGVSSRTAMSVGDVNGDGEIEILTAGGSAIVLMKTDGTIVWQVDKTFQDSARHSSPTFFDFNGDGVPEVLHRSSDGMNNNGDGTFYILAGDTGDILYTDESPSGLFSNHALKNPIVADLDNDGSAEVFIVDLGGDTGTEARHRVYEAPNDDWMPTRAIWNQFAFYNANVNDDGSIPVAQKPHWLTPGQNRWRASPPTEGIAGVSQLDTFTYKANDGVLDSAPATVNLEVYPDGNPPVFLSQPDDKTTVGFPYHYAPIVFDPDVGDVLTFSLTSAPNGMSIDAATGEINWIPAALGDVQVGIAVQDTQNFTALQTFTLSVGNPVTVPNLIGQAQTQAETTLANADLVTGSVQQSNHPSIPAGAVSAQTPPAGAVIEFGGAVDLIISLGPAPEDIDDDGDGFTENEGDCNDNDNSIFPGAVDNNGDGIDQDCDGIDGNLTLTDIIIEPVDPILLQGQSIALKAIGIFDDGTSQNLTGVVTWSNGSPVFVANSAGNFTVTASRGAVSGHTNITAVATITDTIPPVAEISTPTNNTTVTEPIGVIGTATDVGFLKYELAYAPAGEENFTIMTTGSSPVSNGVLGQFDPTLLINDLYTLRLTVFDQGGNQTIAETIVQADREIKVGVFNVTFNDLSLDFVGLPIKVDRTYDSRNKQIGDFGIGWNLGIQTIHIRANRLQGTGWEVLKSGLSFSLTPTSAHKVMIRFQDGSVEEFDLVVSPRQSFLLPLQTVTASYSPKQGTIGELRVLDNTNLIILDAQPGEVQLLDDLTFKPFDPQRFEYTTEEGVVIVLNTTTGVESLRHPSGVVLMFDESGISHSAGKNISFNRDAQGRIRQITDPNGNTQRYSYDANGDLITHTDPDGNTTRFFYDHRHNLIDIADPLSVRFFSNEYDAEGRLIATLDADGNRTEYNHDIAGREEIVRHRDDSLSVLVYDDTGNILTETNPLGDTTSYTYDGRGNELTQTNPLGHTTVSTYDDNDDLLTLTDPLGNVITMTYNNRGQTLTETDAKGNVRNYRYDTKGNLAEEHDPLGQISRSTYDNSGNPLSVTDPLGFTTSFEYDANGNLLTTTNALGHEVSASYDANGNLLTSRSARTTESGDLVTLITQTVYDSENRIIEEVDPLGNRIETEYDALGRQAAIVNSVGARIEFVYDARGHLAQTRFPDGTQESERYDKEGRRISMTDAAGRMTQFVYDDLNRPLQIISPDAGTRRIEYDAAGRITARIDENGNRASFEYDSAGRLLKLIDALSNETTQTFDANGNRTSITDAKGNTTAFTYNANDQLSRTTFADGTFITISYDAAGRRIAETDQAGNSKTFAYDKLSRLISVTDALGQATGFSYDEVGNLIAQTDANGNTTRFAYDDLGRIIKRTLPLGMFEAFGYDANSNVTAYTNFNGQTMTFTYDLMDRLVGKRFPDGSEHTFTYTPTGQRQSVTDSRGTTEYHYDTRDRLLEIIHPDGTMVSYTYDAAGNRTSVSSAAGTVSYTYDALNRLQTVTDADAGITIYSYDAAGNLAGVAYPNGTEAIYTYDSLNRLTQVENLQADGTLISSHSYTLGVTGERLSELDHSGRRIDYTYDAVFKLIQEQITDTTTGNETRNYTYDAVGNRLSKTDSNGSIAYSYDSNDRLLSAGTRTYDYDANGNTLSLVDPAGMRSYRYGVENQLREATTPGGTFSYAYDADGERIEKTANSVTTTFLVDTNRAFSQVLEERNEIGTLITHYTYGNDLISQKRTDSSSFYHYDGLGSTRALSDNNGTATDNYRYKAFGEIDQRTGSTVNTYLYTGEQFDPDIDLYYLRARYYNQRVGRFLTMDTFAGNARFPLSLNKFLYGNADPINNVDPSGNSPLVEVLFSTLIDNIVEKAQVGVQQQVQRSAVRKLKRSLVKQLGRTTGRVSKFNEQVIEKLKKIAKDTKTPMFVLGMGLTDVTLFKSAAIASGQPPLLRYWGKSIGHSRSFLRRGDQCGKLKRGNKNCDEYPYSASVEGGAENGAFGQLVNASNNKSEGSLLGHFLKGCKVAGISDIAGFGKSFGKNKITIPTAGVSSIAPEGVNVDAILITGFITSRFLVIPALTLKDKARQICTKGEISGQGIATD